MKRRSSKHHQELNSPEGIPSPTAESPFRLVFWGTYDLGKPRVRILLRGLRENGVDIIECHEPVWAGIER